MKNSAYLDVSAHEPGTNDAAVKANAMEWKER